MGALLLPLQGGGAVAAPRNCAAITFSPNSRSCRGFKLGGIFMCPFWLMLVSSRCLHKNPGRLSFVQTTGDFENLFRSKADTQVGKSFTPFFDPQVLFNVKCKR